MTAQQTPFYIFFRAMRIAATNR